MREKTKEIIEEHVDIGNIKRDYPVYEIGKEHLKAIKTMDNDVAKATSIAHTTRDYLQPRVGQNPQYKRLSERVTEIVEEWQQDHRGDPEAVEALRSVEEAVLEVEAEAEERGMESAEFAIYTELTENQSNVIESDGQAEEIAHQIVAEFTDRVDTGYEGWAANDRTVQAIELVLLDVLVKEHSTPSLVNDQFIDSVRTYLIENHVD